MDAPIEIRPRGPIDGSICPPGSKSLTNRALVCAALARGKSMLCGALDCDDTRIMVDCLRSLGISIQADWDVARIHVVGGDGKFHTPDDALFVGNSGTTIRFLGAALTVSSGTFTLDGVPRMRQRPIGDLVRALRGLGVDITAANENEFPPVQINASGLPGGSVTVAGHASSQFLSGLLMAAPYAKGHVTLRVPGALVSIPYVDMTVRVMQSFHACVHVDADAYHVSPDQTYVGQSYSIEPDASAASYFWAAAAVTGGRVTVENLSKDSLQGDVQFCDVLQRMGCRVDYGENCISVQGNPQRGLQGIDVDMQGISDTVPTLAVVALFASGPTRICNVAHIRHKETDRIGDLARELRKLGAHVEESPSGLTIHPGAWMPAAIDTYDDHRMAMSFAIAGLREKGVRIKNPACTAKTYPHFFRDLEALA